VPIRGVQPMTFELVGDALPIIEGRNFRPGTDEVIVGSKLPGRIRDCRLDDVVVLNTTPFRVVGVFDHDGPFSSEIWGDVERMAEALERQGFNRVIAKLSPEVSVPAFIERLASHEQVASKAMTERVYFTAQTEALSIVLIGLGGFLAVIMGIAAVFTATTTMLAALAARTHEIGILKSIGFRPVSIFLSFLFESLLLGLMGGVVGCVLTFPINGIETGTMNFNTFTEVAFAFRVTPQVLMTAVTFAVVLGLFGGAWPAWQAARMTPVEAWRRR
jgi:putative ABC transport system permease protein